MFDCQRVNNVKQARLSMFKDMGWYRGWYRMIWDDVGTYLRRVWVGTTMFICVVQILSQSKWAEKWPLKLVEVVCRWSFVGAFSPKHIINHLPDSWHFGVSIDPFSVCFVISFFRGTFGTLWIQALSEKVRKTLKTIVNDTPVSLPKKLRLDP